MEAGIQVWTGFQQRLEELYRWAEEGALRTADWYLNDRVWKRRGARVLRLANEMGGGELVTKSGLMVGLGESFEEMVEAFEILREHRVQILTVGQYLRPTEKHLPVVRYWHPDEFGALERAAYELGFDSVAAGPLVRSSYHADESAREATERRAAAA